MSVRELVNDVTSLATPSIVLIRIPDEIQVLDAIASMLKRLVEERGHKALLILGNRSAGNFMEGLRTYGFVIERAVRQKKLLFIDCLTRSVGGPRVEGALFVSSPSDLSEVSLLMERGFRILEAKPNETWLMIDGLATFIIFNGMRRVLQFLIYTTNRLRTRRYYGVVLYYGSELEKQLENTIRQYVDRIYEV